MYVAEKQRHESWKTIKCWRMEWNCDGLNSWLNKHYDDVFATNSKGNMSDGGVWWSTVGQCYSIYQYDDIVQQPQPLLTHTDQPPVACSDQLIKL